MGFFSGTLFLKLWKRKTATLAYKWVVDEFAMTEPNRPQFYGTRIRQVRYKFFAFSIYFVWLYTLCFSSFFITLPSKVGNVINACVNM